MQYDAHASTKALAQAILENPHGYQWTAQGLGMMRTYIAGQKYRLHIWDSRLRVPNVSSLHTHPWDFESLIVAGQVDQFRFEKLSPLMIDAGSASEGVESWMEQCLRCGAGGGLEGEAVPVFLARGPRESYLEGEAYCQAAREIHDSQPMDGTVTLIERQFHEDTEHAYVYFQGEWVSAEPRTAVFGEVEAVTRNALERWF